MAELRKMVVRKEQMVNNAAYEIAPAQYATVRRIRPLKREQCFLCQKPSYPSVEEESKVIRK